MSSGIFLVVMIESNDSFPAVARVPEKVGLLGSQQPEWEENLERAWK